jgi:hypothetical protein
MDRDAQKSQLKFFEWVSAGQHLGDEPLVGRRNRTLA